MGVSWCRECAVLLLSSCVCSPVPALARWLACPPPPSSLVLALSLILAPLPHPHPLHEGLFDFG